MRRWKNQVLYVHKLVVAHSAVFEVKRGQIAYFRKVEGAYSARQSDGNTRIGRDKNVRECSREKYRFCRCMVITVNEINSVLIDTLKNRFAEFIELAFRIT